MLQTYYQFVAQVIQITRLRFVQIKIQPRVGIRESYGA